MNDQNPTNPTPPSNDSTQADLSSLFPNTSTSAPQTTTPNPTPSPPTDFPFNPTSLPISPLTQPPESNTLSSGSNPPEPNLTPPSNDNLITSFTSQPTQPTPPPIQQPMGLSSLDNPLNMPSQYPPIISEQNINPSIPISTPLELPPHSKPVSTQLPSIDQLTSSPPPQNPSQTPSQTEILTSGEGGFSWPQSPKLTTQPPVPTAATLATPPEQVTPTPPTPTPSSGSNLNLHDLYGPTTNPSPLDQVPITPPTPDSSIVPPEPKEAAPEDLSQLIANQKEQPSVYTPPLSQPQTLVTPPNQVSATSLEPHEEHGSIPKWVIGLGVGLLLAVAGASGYFILGIGQTQAPASIPANQEQSQITPPKSSPTTVPAQVNTPMPAATNSATPSSALDLLRQRQTGQ